MTRALFDIGIILSIAVRKAQDIFMRAADDALKINLLEIIFARNVVGILVQVSTRTKWSQATFRIDITRIKV